MTYLVDSNVLSEPTKQSPSAKVVNWLAANENNLSVNPIILAELRIGVLSLPKGRKRKQLERWFESLVETVDCIAWDCATGLRWAELVAERKRKGATMPLLDSMIAATALEHDLTIATRNTRDFQKAGIRVIDPFS